MPPLARVSCPPAAARTSAGGPDWPRALRHGEVFASSREASGAAAALALARDALAAAEPAPGAEAEDRRALLWVQDKAALRLGGRPYRPGLPRGAAPPR